MAAVAHADLVLVATPIYKASCSGLLKTCLDVLPVDALRDKTVLPLATGGSPAHLLAVDCALKPVLGAMDERSILDAVCATDDQPVAREADSFVPDAALLRRLDRALQPLLQSSEVRAAAPLCSS